MIRANHNVIILNRICRASYAVGLLFAVMTLPTFAQQIHQLSSDGTSWTEQNLNGSLTGARGIAAYLTTPNDQKHVYYLSSGSTPDIHQLFFNGVGWADDDLTVLSGAAHALQFSAVNGFSVGNFQYVYYIGQSNHVHQLLYNNLAWRDLDLSSLSGVQAGLGALLAFTTTPDLHVYYTASRDSHIHQLYSSDGVNWQDQDLTAITGGTFPRGTTNPWLAGFNIGNFQYVYFVSAGHVHQFLYNNFNWTDSDLNVLTKTPATLNASVVSAVAIPGTTNLRVFYTTTGGSVELLANSNNTTWSRMDLTIKAKAPAGYEWNRTVAVTTTPSHQVHVFYVAAARNQVGHVIQLYKPTATTWSYQDMTALTNGGIVANSADIAGFSFKNTQSIYYAAP